MSVNPTTRYWGKLTSGVWIIEHEPPYISSFPSGEAEIGRLPDADQPVNSPPLREIYRDGMPLYLKPADGKVYEMSVGNEEDYIGIVKNPQKFLGSQVGVAKGANMKFKAHVSENMDITIGDLLMCDATNTDYPYDVTKQPDAEYRATGVVAADALTYFDWSSGGLAALTSATFYDIATEAYIPITVIANDTADPADLQVSLFPDSNQFRFGRALADGDILRFYGNGGNVIRKFTIGEALETKTKRSGATAYRVLIQAKQ